MPGLAAETWTGKLGDSAYPMGPPANCAPLLDEATGTPPNRTATEPVPAEPCKIGVQVALPFTSVKTEPGSAPVPVAQVAGDGGFTPADEFALRSRTETFGIPIPPVETFASTEGLPVPPALPEIVVPAAGAVTEPVTENVHVAELVIAA